MSGRNEKTWTIFDMLKDSMSVTDIITTAILAAEVRTENAGWELSADEAYKSMVTIAVKMRLSVPSLTHEDFHFIYLRVTDSFDWEKLLFQCYDKDRSSSILVSTPLMRIMDDNLKGAVSVLIADGEKFTPNLKRIVDSHSMCRFTITTENTMYAMVITQIFKGYENVTVQKACIYKTDFSTDRFDRILSVPSKGITEDVSDSICHENEMIAFQNLLYHLTLTGELTIVLPARITFAPDEIDILRKYILKMYNLKMIAGLPKDALLNTNVKSSLIRVAFGRTDKIDIINFDYIGEKSKSSPNRFLEAIQMATVTKDDLEENGDWNINKLLARQDDDFSKYQATDIRRVSLDSVAKVFRGKATFKNEKYGNIGIVNISNIGEYDIDYDNLDRFYEEDERKISNYILKTGDVLIPSRCTNVHAVIFKEQANSCIASSNVIVIRPNSEKLNSTYLKLFIDSPVGKALIHSQQQGTSVMNISYKDLKAMEIPLLSLAEQARIADEYVKAYEEYQTSISKAKSDWQSKLSRLQKFWD